MCILGPWISFKIIKVFYLKGTVPQCLPTHTPTDCYIEMHEEFI